MRFTSHCLTLIWKHHFVVLVTGLNWMVVIPLMACLLLSLLGNIILICRLKIRDHEYQLPQKDQEMIQTVKRSVALTEETQLWHRQLKFLCLCNTRLRSFSHCQGTSKIYEDQEALEERSCSLFHFWWSHEVILMNIFLADCETSYNADIIQRDVWKTQWNVARIFAENWILLLKIVWQRLWPLRTWCSAPWCFLQLFTSLQKKNNSDKAWQVANIVMYLMPMEGYIKYFWRSGAARKGELQKLPLKHRVMVILHK